LFAFKTVHKFKTRDNFVIVIYLEKLEAFLKSVIRSYEGNKVQLVHLPLVKFYSFYLKAANADAVVEKRVTCLALLALAGPSQLCYWPSTIAAAVVILACLELNQKASHKVIGVITAAL
jgi:hypothetical protein